MPYVVPQFVGMVVFFIGGIAETSRAPFDLPEAEQELVAGYHTEYSRHALGPLPDGRVHQPDHALGPDGDAVLRAAGTARGALGPLWFLLKLVVVLFVFIWLRATLPRLRYDQLMRFGWKVLLPVATINAVVTAALVVAL